MVLLAPLPGLLTKMMGTVSRETMKRKDARVQLVTESDSDFTSQNLRPYSHSSHSYDGDSDC